jgi:hypothetical protein
MELCTTATVSGTLWGHGCFGFIEDPFSWLQNRRSWTERWSHLIAEL